VSNLNKEEFERSYQAGKKAFECGEYRISIKSFEQAVTLISNNSRLGGEVQMWLVNANLANNKLEEAIALCQSLTTHPHPQIREQSKDILYILQAPQLKRPKEWMSEIPDLNNLSETPTQYNLNNSQTQIKSPPQIETVDLSKVNRKDNQFIWLALCLILLLLISFLMIS
jgi:hypothetical protein